MANLSQLIKNGQTLQAKAGPVAINPNDLVCLGGYPIGLYPAQVSDYAAVAAAGSAAIALTTYSQYGNNNSNATRNYTHYDAATGDLYVLDSYMSPAAGCQIWRYNAQGQLIATAILDAAANNNNLMLQPLTNGNLLAVWANIATPYTIYFQILDKSLGTVVGKTTIASASTNPQANLHATALSGGGFAVAYCIAGIGSYITIRDSAGAIVKAPTSIAGMLPANSGSSLGPRFRLAQLSNGSIVVAIADCNSYSGNTPRFQFAMFDVSGNPIGGTNTLYNGGAVSASPPEIAVMPGYFCVVCPGVRADVFTNAGGSRGSVDLSNYSSQTNASTATVLYCDGTYFWLGLYRNAGGVALMRIDVNAAFQVASSVANINIKDWFFDRGGAMIVFDTTNVYAFIFTPGNPTLTLIQQAAFAMSAYVIGNVGDFCAISLQSGKFSVIKYFSASIFGIAQNAVAAGNSGSLVTVNEGPGGYITNELRGGLAKTFDHLSATPPGNKGVLYNNSIVLKGI